MKPLHHAAGVAGQKIKDHLPGRRPDAGSTGSPPTPSDGQTFVERLALEDGSMPLPRMDTAQPRQPGDATGQPPPASQHPIPDATTLTAPGSEKQPQSTANKRQPPQTPASPPAAVNLPQVGQVLDNIQRLKDKAKDGPLSLEEQRELDHNEKVLAQTRIKNLEKEQQVIRSLPQPRELDPVKAKALETERAILQRPVPGEPTAGGGAGEPVPVPSDSGEASPSPLPGNDGHGGEAPPPPPPPTPPPPPPPPPSEGTSSKSSTLQGQNAASAGQHGGSATVDVPAPGPRFHEKNPDILDQHRKKFKEQRDAPRDTEAEAALLKERDERVRNAQPASEALHRHNNAGSLAKVAEMGGKHINEANILEAPDGNTALHKPDDGQSKKKIRAGVEPGTTGQREVAASKISQALGIDLVPPTSMLTHDGRPGSAQVFKKGMVNGEFAGDPSNGYNIKIDRDTQLPEGLPPGIAHDWQLMDDLLMHSDRHSKNYMLRLDNGKIAEAALVDNGHSLPANTGVVEKRYLGPLEGRPLSPLNQARLHRMLDNEESLRHSLKDHLEPEAIDGLFARAKALLARGSYGNFTLDEINAHLPPEKQRSRPVAYYDTNQ